MISRRHGRKPTIALWMLVAVADAAILFAMTGVVAALCIVAGLVALAGGFVAMQPMLRRNARSATAVVRRRA